MEREGRKSSRGTEAVEYLKERREHDDVLPGHCQLIHALLLRTLSDHLSSSQAIAQCYATDMIAQ